MTFFNEGGWDRGFRMILGFVLVLAGWQFLSGGFATGALILGVIALVTGAIGWCPLYSVVGCSTRRART